jgi:hypothetical protein
MKRKGISMTEIVLGALILGTSGVTVLELVRGSTVNLQVTEVEAAARGMAADLLERYSRPSVYDAPGESANLTNFLGRPLSWDQHLEDPATGYGFPRENIGKLLDQYQARFTIGIDRVQHPTFGNNAMMTKVSVTAEWNDPIPGGARGSTSDLRAVTYACLIDR